jgi:tetratricopeptide (TPR) repeat protein
MRHSKARKQRRAARQPDIAQLRKRTAEALARGAFRSARELAKELCKQDPAAEHRCWLVEATAGRAAQLRQSGQAAEATTMLRTVVDDEFDSPELLARCASELMLAGDWGTAEQLARRVADVSLLQELRAQRADAAVLQAEDGLANVPEDIRPGAQRVLQALAALAQGDDAAARAAVAGIPSDSPLHDWSLFVQGLTAFYTDGLAALELWQQLTPDRAPAAIATPFQAQIDAAFLESHPQPQRAELAAFGQRLYAGAGLVALEDVHRLLARGALPPALRRAGEAWQALPPECHELRERLARLMYWEVAQRGSDREIEMYARALEAPPEDPELHRLRALQCEQQGYTADAQDHWAAYERSLTQHNIVSATDVALARSLLWLHMGELAEEDGPPMPAALSALLPSQLDDEGTCTFAASECYRRSVELAPQHLQAHEHLIDWLHAEQKQPEVVRAARHLLEHFPEHQRALEALADDAFRQQRWDEAVAFQERAVRARPHDANLTALLDFYRLGLARLRAQQEQFDEARAILMARLEKETASGRSHVLCRLAAVELKAGQQQRAMELFAQACHEAPSRLVAVFEMLIESIRMPLDRTWTKQLTREFRHGLKANADGPSVVALLTTLYAFQTAGITYEGLQEHWKLVWQSLKRARHLPFSEVDLKSICTCLQAFPDNKLLLDIATRGCQEFPQQPAFPFAVGAYYLSLGPERCPWSAAHAALRRAHDLAQADPAHAELARTIEALLPAVQSGMIVDQFERGRHPFGRDAPSVPEMLEAVAGLFDLSPDDDEDDGPWQRTSRRARKRW